jgi:hypothetical protein
MKTKLMKTYAGLKVGISLAVLGMTLTPAIAQQTRHERYATTSEVRSIRQKVRHGGCGSSCPPDRRSTAERRSIQSFIRAWSQVDPAIAPFLGSWSPGELYGELFMSIYPSTKKGRVCIINEGEGGGFLNLGNVSHGLIRTDVRYILFKEGAYLAGVTVDNGKAQLWPFLINPNKLQDPNKLTVENRQELMQKFSRSGCTASLPKRR